MRRWLVVLMLFLSLGLLAETAKRKGKKRKGGKGGKGGKKMMKMDACTMAGHPCMLGQECVVEKYTGEERCVCQEHCPSVPNAQVCGSDMVTYETACHLYQHACDTHRMISAVAFGPCDMYHTSHLKIQPEMAEVCENGHAAFKCQYDSMVERIVGWRKDDEPIRGGRKYRIQGASLVIQWVLDIDQGNYTCVTSDNNGTIRTANATLKMTRVPYAEIPSEHINCQYGDRVMIQCDHSPDSKVSWMKNGFELDMNDGNMEMDNTGMLILQQTEYDAAGTYQCVANNFCGTSKAECNVNVTRRDPNRCAEGVDLVECVEDPCANMTCASRPELRCQATKCGQCGYEWIDATNRNVTCPELKAPVIVGTQLVSLTPEGEDAVIPCTATGYPTPTITWTLADGSSIDGIAKHSLRGNDTLVIRQLVMGRDNGRYKCVAENSVGRVEAVIVVAIMPRMTPMCPNEDDKIMRCEHDFCATAECPAYAGTNNVTCINTVCNVCTYIFVDKMQNYVDCYADPKAMKMMKMGGMGGMGAMPGWPAGSSMGGSSSMGGGQGSMGGMGAMPGWPAGSSMGGMGAMPGWPAGSSMGGMGAMPGWPAGSSMGGSNMGGSNMGSSNMGSSKTGGSMAMMDKHAWHNVPGWPGHMSQMGNMGGSGNQGGSGSTGGGGDGGHLRQFYSGVPDDEEEEAAVEDTASSSNMGH